MESTYRVPTSAHWRVRGVTHRYAGDVVVGIASDDHQVADARLLLDDVIDEVQSLTATAAQ